MPGDQDTGGISPDGENLCEGAASVRRDRLRAIPGGRRRQVIVRLSDDEHGTLERRARTAGVSLQRYLVEAGLSGHAGDGAARRSAERELMQARAVLRAAGNNLNQLTKWANANGAIPAQIESVLATVRSATGLVSKRADALASTFETFG
jgi:hypothetical protein